MFEKYKANLEKMKTPFESLSKSNKSGTTNESSIVEKLRDEVVCLTIEFGKFLESSNTLTMLIKFH